MAVPKRRTTPARRDRRRTHHALSSAGLTTDKQTKSVHLSHHVDLKTGLYRGKQILFREEEEIETDENTTTVEE